MATQISSPSEIRRTLAEHNNNFKLYTLKKKQLQEICLHYGLETNGTKNILEKRIINERDSIYHMSFHEPSQNDISLLTSRYRISRIRSYTFYESTKQYIFRNSLQREPKINIVTLYIYLQKIKDPNYNKSYLELFEDMTRDELVNDMKNDCDHLVANAMPPPPQRTRKTLHIQNLSDQVVYIYYSRMRNDHPRFSQCNCLMNILPGNTNTMYYFDDNTNVIFSKMNIGREVYYMDLQDQSAIIQENMAGSLNGRIEFKGNKGELEQWKEAALKADFLIKQLKRLGIEKNENYSIIVDMHQDITIPEHTERDKEVAGIPSTLTNVT